MLGSIGIVGAIGLAVASLQVADDVTPKSQETKEFTKHFIPDEKVEKEEISEPIVLVKAETETEDCEEIESISNISSELEQEAEIDSNFVAEYVPQENNKCVQRSMNDSTEINKICVNGAMRIEIRMGNENSVEVEDGEEGVNAVKVNQEKGILSLTNNARSGRKSTVRIVTKSMESINLSGTGDIELEMKEKVDDLKLMVCTVGDVNLTLKCNSVDMNYSGTGDLRMSGSAEEATFIVCGVGDIKAKDFRTKKMKIVQSGIGGTKIHASDYLKVNLSGIGNIKYYGNPTEKEINRSGLSVVESAD